MIRTLRASKSLKLTQRVGYASSASSNITSLESGVKVVSLDSGSATSTISLVAKAGSRYETKLGLSHYLKNFAFKNTTKRTAFRVTRETELQGGSLSATLTRENIIYTAQFFREDAPYFIEALTDVAQHTKYADYEGVEVGELVALERDLANPEVQVINSLHREAYRTGLGNSTLAPQSNGVNSKDLLAYSKQVLAPSRLTVVGLNIDSATLSSELNKQFEDATPSSSSLPTTPTKYFGGESRTELPGSATGHLAIGFEGAALGSDSEATLIVMRHILGGQVHMKWGSGVSPLAKIAASSGAQISAFNFGYSDSGLFGMYVAAPSSKVAGATNLAIAELRKLASGVSAEHLKRAIAQAKFEAATTMDNQFSSSLLIGTQASALGKISSFADLSSRFGSVTDKQVSEAAKKLLASKPTLITKGHLADMPYLDQLTL